MKVLMLTLGTRGDVQPFVALALELEGWATRWHWRPPRCSGRS